MSLTLAEYAAAKRLPEPMLHELGARDGDWFGTPAVAIAYRDQDGGEIVARYRLSMNGAADAYRWPRGTRAKGLVYGLDGWKRAAVAGWALLVEGESDVQTCRLHDVPCFGIPGAGMFDDERAAPCLEGIGTLYVVQEPGDAGETFVAALAASRLADRLAVVRFDGFKDVSEVHLAVAGDDERFRAAIEQAIARADRPVEAHRVPRGTRSGHDAVSAPPGVAETVSMPTVSPCPDVGGTREGRTRFLTPGDPPGFDLTFVDSAAFAAVDEPGADALVGDDDEVLIPEGGDVMGYGTGGAHKTTLFVDLSVHLAAGDDWLGIGVRRPCMVAIVENEGPRPLFRAKLRRKLRAWSGSPLEGRLLLLEEPWGNVTLDDEAVRSALAAKIAELALDVVVIGPLTRSGMNEAGTLQHVRDYTGLLADVRARAGRRVTFVIVHHENRAGQVSGAWEGAVDTLFHVTAQGHGRTRLYVQKARWSPAHHQQTLHLAWADGEAFEVVESEARDEDTIADELLQYVLADGGTGWVKVEKALKGQGDRLRTIRDRLLAGGRLVNRGTETRMKLWHADDPALPPGQATLGGEVAG